jgi:cell division protein FtsB
MDELEEENKKLKEENKKLQSDLETVASAYFGR